MHELYQPLHCGKITLKNRLVMPPMAMPSALPDGRVSEDNLRHYDEKSKGGYLGLVICEHCYMDIKGKMSKGQISISSDDDIEGLTKLADVLHKNGVTAFVQINHAGSAARPEIEIFVPLSSSATALPKRGPFETVTPREMTAEEIEEFIQSYAAAAKRAKAAGFDGVEIHSAHGYLLGQFYSPLINKRTDQYRGDCIEGRIRLHLAVIKAVREAVGEDYPIALRLGACDYTEGGSTKEDSVQAAIAFEKAGVDLLDISGGLCNFTRPGHDEPGYFSELTEAIKQAVSIPVILTGGITDPEDADRLLREGKADLIGVGRAILKDSLWAQKAMTRA